MPIKYETHHFHISLRTEFLLKLKHNETNTHIHLLKSWGGNHTHQPPDLNSVHFATFYTTHLEKTRVAMIILIIFTVSYIITD